MQTVHLKTLKRDFQTISTELQQLFQQVLDQGVSNWPILIASREQMELGLEIYSTENTELLWNFRITILEELVKKGVVDRERADTFKHKYNDPGNTACILVVMHDSANFVFVPFQDSSLN